MSVSSQRDSEHALLAKEKRELAETPDDERTELAAIYEVTGLSPATAWTVAEELIAHDALAAHLDAELNLDPQDIASPAQVAAASALSFTLGALLPFLAILLPTCAPAGGGVMGHDHLMAGPASGGDFNIAWEPIPVLFTSTGAADAHLINKAQVDAAVASGDAYEAPLPQLTFNCSVVNQAVYALGTPLL